MVAQKRACDACHKRKIQCDVSEALPECNWCHYQKVPCTFDRLRGRGRRKKLRGGSAHATVGTNESTESLERKLNLSDVLDDGEGHGHSSSSPGQSTITSTPADRSFGQSRPCHQGPPGPHAGLGYQQGQSSSSFGSGSGPGAGPSPLSQSYARRLNSAVLGQIYYAGHNVGRLCVQNGFPHLTTWGEEWIYSRTGQRPSFNKNLLPRAQLIRDAGQPLKTTAPKSSSDAWRGQEEMSLPPKWVAQSLLQRFSEIDISRVFPLVDPVLFRQTIELAYCPHDAPPTLEHVCAKACVSIFLAMGGYHLQEPEISRHVDRDACAREVERLIPSFIEDTSLTTLQTVTMMAMHECLCGRQQSMSMYHAFACRILFALGGHAQMPAPSRNRALSWEEREDRQIRTLFWIAYVYDKSIALQTGQSPIINDDFCDLTLPEGYVEHRLHAHTEAGPSSHSHGDDKHGEDDEGRQLWFPGDLRLAILKSKACSGLYSIAALRKSDAELLRTIRELDEQLECWRASMPPDYSPLLYISKDMTLAPELSETCTTMQIEVTLDYHYLVNVIHSASSRCSFEGDGLAKEQSCGVQSSLEISVQASRSTLIFLSAAAHRLTGEAFWPFIIFPLSAVMTLFINILRNPLGEHALQDMDLFRTASTAIQKMPISRVSSAEMAYLQQVNDFIMELSRLSELSWTRAHRFPRLGV